MAIDHRLYVVQILSGRTPPGSQLQGPSCRRDRLGQATEFDQGGAAIEMGIGKCRAQCTSPFEVKQSLVEPCRGVAYSKMPRL